VKSRPALPSPFHAAFDHFEHMNSSLQELLSPVAVLLAASCRGTTLPRIVAGVGLTILVALSAARAQEAQESSRQNRPNATERSDLATAPAQDCAGQLRNFVRGLDQLLDKNPNIYPVLGLLRQYFPVKSCNIPEAVEICRGSKYFDHVSEDRTYYVIAFSSKPSSLSSRIYVQLSLQKDSGDSQLPFAKVKKWGES
jgi:hypothetical protein